MNIPLLKSKMALCGDNQTTLAEALDISKNSMCFKFAGKTPFKRGEIEMIIKRYQLTGDEVKEIFFGSDPLEKDFSGGSR